MSWEDVVNAGWSCQPDVDKAALPVRAGWSGWDDLPPGTGYRYSDTSHTGASLSRKQMSNWAPMRLPADSDLLPDLGMLVGRTRDLHRNNGIASGGLQTLQDNVAGYGLRLSAWPDYRALGKDINWAEEWALNVNSLFADWASTTSCDIANELNFAQMTQLVFRSAIENGEALALVMWEDRPNTKYKTCFQLIESDRLSNPYNQLPTVKMIGGIEKDDYGRPLAYWIRRMMLWFNGWWMLPEENAWKWDRIPAEVNFGGGLTRKRVLHMHVKERIAQTRGKPILTPVIEQFRMLDSYQRAELQSALVNALVAGVIETPMDPQSISDLMNSDPNAYLANKNQYRVRLEGGSFIPLYPGDKLTPFVPSRPSVQFGTFVEAVARQIGTALGLPYELALKDFSKTTYSSARAALLEAWRFFQVRRHWLATQWATPVYKLWLEEAVDKGLVDAPDFYENPNLYGRAKWIGMGRGWIDPVKEAEAAQLRMQSSISTLEAECAEQGLDWNEVLDQRALEQSRMKELGLEIPVITLPPKETPPGGPGGEPGAQPPAPQEEAA